MEQDPYQHIWPKMHAALDAYEAATTERRVLEPTSTSDEQYKQLLDRAVDEARAALLEMERRTEVPENWVPFAMRPREVGMLIGSVTHRLNKQLREYEKPKQVERRAALEAEGRADVAIKAIQATADLLGRLRATADHHRIPHGPDRATRDRHHEYVAAYAPGGDRCGVCGHPQRDPVHFAPHAYQPGHGRRPFFGCYLCGAVVEHPIHQVER